MGIIDWSIVVGFVLLLCGASFGLARVSRSVEDFMAAGRCAGRFLLSMANDMGGFAAIFVVATFEMFYQSGYPAAWWSVLFMPGWAIIMVSGWVQYRFRETRALTMPHFFEMRYGRNVRVAAAALAFLAGILNYGIFPGVTANLLIAFMDLPREFLLLGVEVPTVLPVMLVVLGIAMFVLLSGGLVSVMVTDFLQGMLVLVGTLLIAGYVIWFVGPTLMFEGATVAPEGQSRIDPFGQSEIRSFSLAFFLIQATYRYYQFMAFPTRAGYDAAATTPDEAKFSRMLGDWLFNVRQYVLLVLPIGAWVIMHNAGFGEIQATVQGELALIEDDAVRGQMTVPTVLAAILPAGLIGLFVAMMVGAAVSTDNTFVHSWGSIFVHDVVEPLRKRPLSERAKLTLLRAATFGVAAFAVVWSLTFPIQDFIFMYFQITAGIYIAGGGILVIGGLYWSRGTTAGAWAAMAVGCGLSVAGIALQQLWPVLYGQDFFLNGAYLFFIAMCAAIAAYVLVSLVTCREPVDLDAMLHRTDPATDAQRKAAAWERSIFNFGRFRWGSRATVVLYLTFVAAVVGVFVVGNAARLFVELGDGFWVGFWQVFVAAMFLVAIVMSVVFIAGGIGDIVRLRRLLAGTAETPETPETPDPDAAPGTVAGGPLAEAAPTSDKPTGSPAVPGA